ncbi:hypothetical protein V5N11_034615 [Cardamine amara subsp. amara]|uniref:Reverse transcriptase domain-containing protein n=1 Tax=Cardamine amara subsp. amara TaxID=228776 RepID=A0ABD1AS15_CARAN
MLNKAAREGRFGFHPKCCAVGVTHLSFADEILVFSDGKPDSVLGIVDVFKEFAVISGLNINVAKSSLFLVRNGKAEPIQEASELGLAHSKLPICYLGLPLTMNSMTLIDRIRSCMLSWNTKASCMLVGYN